MAGRVKEKSLIDWQGNRKPFEWLAGYREEFEWLAGSQGRVSVAGSVTGSRLND